MTNYRQPPLMGIYLSHAIGTAVLGALLPSGQHLQSLHTAILPMLKLFPGAIAITKNAPDIVFAQVFLALSLLIAVCVLIGAVLFVSRGGYHTRTFKTAAARWRALVVFWFLTAFMMTVVWNVPYVIDGAQDRIYFLIKAATSSTFGVLTAMNQLIVGMPLVGLLTSLVIPFCTNVKSKTS
jgi:hypothetical protein